MANTNYTVKVYTRKGEFYASESFGREYSALGRALAWTSIKGQKAWTAHVWHGETRIASYRNGRQFVPRTPAAETSAAPPAQPSALERPKNFDDVRMALRQAMTTDKHAWLDGVLDSLVSEVRAKEREHLALALEAYGHTGMSGEAAALIIRKASVKQ